jgi:hypothetical protein
MHNLKYKYINVKTTYCVITMPGIQGTNDQDMKNNNFPSCFEWVRNIILGSYDGLGM